MNVLKRTIGLLWLTLLTTVGYSNSKADTIQKSDIIIEGMITELSMAKLPDFQSYVEVIVSKYPFSLIEMTFTKHFSYIVKCKYGEHFKIRIPATSDRLYMTISFESSNSGMTWSGFDNVYILDKGDRIHCKLSDDFFEFSGKGAEKLRCQSEIYRHCYRMNQEEILLYQKGKFETMFNNLDRKRDSCLLLQKAIIEKYSMALGDKLSQVLLANCYGLRYYQMIRMNRAVIGTDTSPIAFKNSKGFKYMNLNDLKSVPPSLLVGAPIYVNFLFEKLLMDLRKVNNGVFEAGTSEASNTAVYRNIVANYTGILRDKLLAVYFLNRIDQPAVPSFLREAISLMKDSNYKEILYDMIKNRSVGLPFYPFELEDVNGKLLKLSDFKDKVVVLDFWYTGCIGCALLGKVSHPKIAIH